MLLNSKLPRWYAEACLALAAFGWLPFAVLPPSMHGGTVTTEALSWAGIVLGGYCSLELVRASERRWYTSPALAGVLLYGLVTVVGLYYALPRLL
jgi:hypothetical protein